jgi:AcrR family transcriptional regulator
VLYQHFPGKLDLYLALLEQAADRIIGATREALAATPDNKQRVSATVRVFYAYVSDARGAFRLVFESDLTNEPAVRALVDRVTQSCAWEITEVISADTGLSAEESRLLAVALVGMAQVSARFWLDGPGELTEDEAASLISSLAWRGISRFPLAEERAAPDQPLTGAAD